MNDHETQHEYEEEIEEVWQIFAQESKEMLNAVEDALLKLETDPGNNIEVPGLFRSMHTFKGGVRVMGLTTIEALAHYAEDLVALVRDQGVLLTTEMIDLLLKALDQSRLMLEYAMTHRANPDPAQTEELNAQLKAMLLEHAPEGLYSSDDLLEEVVFEPEDALSQEEIITHRAADPIYVQLFMEIAEEELGKLHAAMDLLAEGDQDSISQIETAADFLKHAAGQVGYEGIVTVADDLLAAVRETDEETRRIKLKKIELTLFEKLSLIQETVQALHPEESDSLPDIAWLFRNWHAERVFIDLAALGTLIDELEQSLTQFLAAGGAQEWNLGQLDEMIYLLRAIYHSCLFYKMERPAHLTLAMEDLYARVAQGEMIATKPLINLTRTYVTEVGWLIEATRESQTPTQSRIEEMIAEAKKILYRNAEGRVSQVTRDVLDLLLLPPEFDEVMMPGTLIAIGEALQTNESFYTILVDTEENEEVMGAFYEWSQSGTVRLLTNVTVYRNNHSLFNFLTSTAASYESVAQTIADIDPTGRHLTLQACAMREDITPEDVQQVPTPSKNSSQTERVVENRSAVDMDSLTTLMETVGGMVATHTTLHRIVDRLQEADLVTTMNRLFQQARNDWKGAYQKLQHTVDTWATDLSALSQVETEMGSELEQLHEMALSLRLEPVTQILDPLQRMVEEVANHQNKRIELNLKGADTQLDHRALNILADPLRRLVWFAVTHSLEEPPQRREEGKSAAGQISVAVNKSEDRVQIVVTDDGQGLNPEVVLQRARKLGWTNGSTPLAAELSEWVLQPGFGPISAGNGQEGVDLAALQAELQTYQGRLDLSTSPGQGDRFTLNLPLDMVVVDGMVARVGHIHYVVPVGIVQRIIKPDDNEIVHSSANGSQNVLRMGEDLVPVQTLNGANSAGNIQDCVMVVVGSAEQAIALAVDELLGQQQVLIRPLQGFLTSIEGVSGCALLGDGDVGMVLDLNQMEV